MNKPYFCRNFSLTDWRHKRIKNTIDLLLFYGEHFYGFLESEYGISRTPAPNSLFQYDANQIYFRLPPKNIFS